jgi:hypothetical protein
MLTAFLPLLILISACLGLPLLGALLAREPLGEYLRVPLTSRSFDALPLDREIFGATVLVLSAALLLVAFLAWPRGRGRRDLGAPKDGAFPAWGWAGTLLAALAPLAGRGPWSGFGLTLFLLGLTLLLNAETRGRTGSSLLSQRPWFFVSLFPAGMVLGWIFHYLNLFLQLWHYPAAAVTPAFAIDVSLGYAVLLPALLSLRRWMASYAGLLDLLRHGRSIGGGDGGGEGWILITLSCIGLAGAGIWPDWIYPLTWVSPLLLATGMQRLRSKPTLFSSARQGDWSRILLSALSALVLGVIALTWNRLAGPIWAFELSLIDHARVMGLAAPAYAGFLPLGLLGIWMADQLALPWRKRPQGRFRKFPFKVVIKH